MQRLPHPLWAPRVDLGLATTVAAVAAGVPDLADVRILVERFGTMIRKRAVAELDGWIEHASTSLIAPLARGVAKDAAAIRAAITEPWPKWLNCLAGPCQTLR